MCVCVFGILRVAVLLSGALILRSDYTSGCVLFVCFSSFLLSSPSSTLLLSLFSCASVSSIMNSVYFILCVRLFVCVNMFCLIYKMMHWRNVKNQRPTNRPTVLKRSITLKVMLMLSFGYITQLKTVLAVAATVVFVIPVPSWYTYIRCVCCAWMKNEEHAIVPTRLIYIWKYTQQTYTNTHTHAHSCTLSQTHAHTYWTVIRLRVTRILVVFVIDSSKWLWKKTTRCSNSDALINRLNASCRLFYVRLYLPLLLLLVF